MLPSYLQLARIGSLRASVLILLQQLNFRTAEQSNQYHFGNMVMTYSSTRIFVHASIREIAGLNRCSGSGELYFSPIVNKFQTCNIDPVALLPSIVGSTRGPIAVILLSGFCFAFAGLSEGVQFFIRNKDVRTMVIIAIISLTIGLILEREQAFYEDQSVASVGVTVLASQTLAEEAGEQAERLVQAPGHSAHELAIIAELGSLLLLAVALFGHVMPPKRSARAARTDRIT
jgi:hypothetical protein